MKRPMVIKWLKWIKNCLIAGSEPEEAIDYAINSLLVDEKYQLLYEGQNVPTIEITIEEYLKLINHEYDEEIQNKHESMFSSKILVDKEFEECDCNKEKLYDQ